ncbi:hypothetical protein LC593_11700 [Nostoc sp. CHAB 5844]|nr:hypothetical protein [Nostoc sp. CHAB 5844]
MTLGELWISDFELQANADNYPKSLVPIRANQQLHLTTEMHADNYPKSWVFISVSSMQRIPQKSSVCISLYQEALRQEVSPVPVLAASVTLAQR